MLALDTETTGVDVRHGAQPYLVTFCDEAKDNIWFEWDVDPLTRMPLVIYEDLIEIQEMIDRADRIVLQNPKFDVAALQTVFQGRLKWDWSKVEDCLFAGHLLASNHSHKLEDMVLEYLGINVQPFEVAVHKATEEARRIARRDYPNWAIAKKGRSDMPSAKEKVWKYDMWLPRALAHWGRTLRPLTDKTRTYPEDHAWWTVTSDYANGDSLTTLSLFKKQQELLKQRGLYEIYQERLKLLPVVEKMENYGVTLNQTRLDEQSIEYTREADKCHRVCVNLSDGELESLPVNGRSNALDSVIFDKFKLVSPKKTDKGNPSMDKDVLEHWLLELPPQTKAHVFVRNLHAYRKRKTALGYMKSYKRFWLPINGRQEPSNRAVDRGSTVDWFRLHPSLNPTGTNTLRWSCKNPNEMNISKKEGFNLRYIFGPAPGREWWSLDAQNIELRISAYEAGEDEMIDLFEHPDKPPYFGNYHLLVFDALHPKMFAQYGAECKKRFASTWYGWTKGGNYSIQYGAVEISGTADRAYHFDGAQSKLGRRFTKIKLLNSKMIDQADRLGYVETIPDRTMGGKGYPLLCTRSRWGKVNPTIPLAYHVSGTAMWWMGKGMVRCQEYLDTLHDHHMVMQVHDELVFDFPAPSGTFYGKDGEVQNWKWNRDKVRKLQRLMERGGDDIGIPTPVSVEYHADNWSEGVSV